MDDLTASPEAAPPDTASPSASSLMFTDGEMSSVLDNTEEGLVVDIADKAVEFQSAVDQELSRRKLLCCICNTNPRMKNQTFCAAPCGGDRRAAARAAKARGEAQHRAFQALKQRGGKAFTESIHVFRASCAAQGRGHTRGSFDWCKYQILLEQASRVQRGTRSVWLDKNGFIAQKAKVGVDVIKAA